MYIMQVKVSLVNVGKLFQISSNGKETISKVIQLFRTTRLKNRTTALHGEQIVNTVRMISYVQHVQVSIL